MGAQISGFDIDAGLAGGGGGCFGNVLARADIFERAAEEGAQFAGHTEVREAVAAVAGDFDVEDGIVTHLLDHFHRQAGVGQALGQFPGVERSGQILRKPFQTDLHGGIHCIRGVPKVNAAASQQILKLLFADACLADQRAQRPFG